MSKDKMSNGVSVCALIRHPDKDNNKILSVSRKDDTTDFGLPGGKVEGQDSTWEDAVVRELYEETGLSDTTVIPSYQFSFARPCQGFYCMTYRVKCANFDFDRDRENGKIVWKPHEELLTGTFGCYNFHLAKCLYSHVTGQQVEVPHFFDEEKKGFIYSRQTRPFHSRVFFPDTNQLITLPDASLRFQ